MFCVLHGACGVYWSLFGVCGLLCVVWWLLLFDVYCLMCAGVCCLFVSWCLLFNMCCDVHAVCC